MPPPMKRTLRPWIAAAALTLAGCAGDPYEFPPHELSMRFVHPELFEGRDDFARPNALLAMLRRKVLRRGMEADDVRGLLGWPDRCFIPGQEHAAGGSFSIGEPFVWRYYELQSSDFEIEFDRDERAARFTWSHDEGGPPAETW